MTRWWTGLVPTLVCLNALAANAPQAQLPETDFDFGRAPAGTRFASATTAAFRCGSNAWR